MNGPNRPLFLIAGAVLLVFACAIATVIAGFILFALPAGIVQFSQGEPAHAEIRVATPSLDRGPSGRMPDVVQTPVIPPRPVSTPAPGDQPALSTPVPHSPDFAQDNLTRLAQAAIPTRDLRDLALRLRPDVDEIPIVVNSHTPDHQVGEVIEFWVSNIDRNEQSLIRAALIHRTDVAYAWVEEGQSFDRRRISASIDRFSQNIYPTVRAFFGSEWSPGVDNDPRIHILHATNLGRFVAGYYSSADQFSRLANPYSNEKEMFYISLDWVNRAQDYITYETVLAHEFQHMIHWYNDRNEETWVNEGLSELAQEIAGYPPDVRAAQVYANQPDTQLNTWSDNPSGNQEHYGSAYLFMAYLFQRFGPELTQAIVAHPANGTRGISAALAEAGYDLTFDDVFADWVIANYVDEPDALGRSNVYGYSQLNAPRPRLDMTHQSFPVPTRVTDVRNYGVDYIALRGGDALTLHFAGETESRLADLSPYSGDFMWWSNRSDDSNSRLTRRFDFSGLSPGDAIEMSVAMWYDIEVDYDYGYVVVSVDGEKWEILPGQRTTTANPSGNSFGHAYTGQSGDGRAEWVTERFDLSAYAGQELLIRFEYVTDDAVNYPGWFIDDIAIPAIGYFTDFESLPQEWEAEGWHWTDNRLPQRWLLQLMLLNGGRLVEVQSIPVGEDGRATVEIDGLARNVEAILTVSGRTPFTTEPATYEYWVEER